jgi:ABC-type antimicrobial peptide transport system permease subunit
MAVAFVMLGLYGVVSFSVSRRTAEFGVRMAIGASGRSILALVLRQGIVMAATGALIGLALAVAFGRALSRLPFQIAPLDPLTLGSAVAIAVLVTLAASWLPARRASRVSPLLAIRSD